MRSHAAVVTGGSSGIGRSVIKRLATHMPVLSLDIESAEATVENELEPVIGDVRSEEIWRQVKRRLDDSQLFTGVLVHNAGTAVISPVTATSRDDFMRVIEVNLLSAFIGTKVLWDDLVDTGGSVVCVGSVAAVVGQDAAAGYVASKGGLVAMVRALAVELAPHGVRVNAVSPGPVDTPLLRRHFASLEGGDAARAQLIRRLPLGRLLVPEDISPLIEFLTVGESRAITGAHYMVDGGLTATFDYGSDFAGGGTHDD